MGKLTINDEWPCSMVMLNYQRVSSGDLWNEFWRKDHSTFFPDSGNFRSKFGKMILQGKTIETNPKCSMVLVYLPTIHWAIFWGQMLGFIFHPWSIWEHDEQWPFFKNKPGDLCISKQQQWGCLTQKGRKEVPIVALWFLRGFILLHILACLRVSVPRLFFPSGLQNMNTLSG